MNVSKTYTGQIQQEPWHMHVWSLVCLNTSTRYPTLIKYNVKLEIISFLSSYIYRKVSCVS